MEIFLRADEVGVKTKMPCGEGEDSFLLNTIWEKL